jgi:hypothetical protein
MYYNKNSWYEIILLCYTHPDEKDTFVIFTSRTSDLICICYVADLVLQVLVVDTRMSYL